VYEFHEIKTGFSETVAEYQHEKRLGEIGQGEISSNNPFEVLGNENINIAQPLGSSEIIGGELQNRSGERAIGDLTNQFVEANKEEKPISERFKEGISEASSKISSKVSEAKEKILSAFGSTNQENVASS